MTFRDLARAHDRAIELVEQGDSQYDAARRAAFEVGDNADDILDLTNEVCSHFDAENYLNREGA